MVVSGESESQTQSTNTSNSKTLLSLCAYLSGCVASVVEGSIENQHYLLKERDRDDGFGGLGRVTGCEVLMKILELPEAHGSSG